MLVLVQGSTGAGKTWFMVNKLLKPEWERNTQIYPNFPMWFDNISSNITRWHVLDDTFHLSNGIIAIDEGQKLLNARRWASLPIGFSDKIAEHRHEKLDIITASQDISHIDVRLRQNIHELYTCQSILRIPRNQRKKPFFQILRINKKIKMPSSDSGRLRWKSQGNDKMFFLSKYWTKTFYDTHGQIGANDFLCKIKLDQKLKSKKHEWKAKIYATDLVNSGKARL